MAKFWREIRLFFAEFKPAECAFFGHLQPGAFDRLESRFWAWPATWSAMSSLRLPLDGPFPLKASPVGEGGAGSQGLPVLMVALHPLGFPKQKANSCRMLFDEIKSRLTGVSCPIFGISWKPPESERKLSRKVVTFLEDRRVLYAPGEVENVRHCLHSVIDIRRFLTDSLSQCGDGLDGHLRAMRAACRRFQSRIERFQKDDDRMPSSLHGGFAWEFNLALGELRASFGLHIAQIAVRHGLDVESPLDSILPAED